MHFVFSGLLVGLLVGLTGVGGGSLMTPILMLMFGIHPSTAVGTDLIYAAVTKSVGTAVHAFNRTIAWRVTLLLALGSAPTALAMIVALRALGSPGPVTADIITIVLGVSLALTGLAMLFRKVIQRLAEAGADRLGATARAALTVLTGIVLGVLVSISSVGAGALGVSALTLLYPRLPTARIVGSDIAHAVPLALIAGIGHWLNGAVAMATVGLLLIGSIPGVVAGALVAPRLSDDILRPALAIVLMIVGVRLILPMR